MKIILTETIEKVGKAGQVINVKDGFARNYLLPQKLAIIASINNLKKIEDIESAAKAKAEQKNNEYKAMAEKVSQLNACFSRRAEEDGRLFGSVSEVDIVNYLTDNSINCTKSNVVMDKHIKTTGEYEVKISFTSEIFANLKIKVEATI